MALARCDHLVFVIETEQRQHGTEDFLTHDGHIIGASGKDRWLNEVAAFHNARRQALAAEFERSALGLAGLDVGQHALHMRPRDQRADLRLRRQRIADAQFARALDQLLQERIMDVAMDVDAGAVGADFALGVEVAEHGGRYRLVQIGIGEDDERGLARKLHGRALHGGGGGG